MKTYSSAVKELSKPVFQDAEFFTQTPKSAQTFSWACAEFKRTIFFDLHMSRKTFEFERKNLPQRKQASIHLKYALSKKYSLNKLVLSMLHCSFVVCKSSWSLHKFACFQEASKGYIANLFCVKFKFFTNYLQTPECEHTQNKLYTKVNAKTILYCRKTIK